MWPWPGYYCSNCSNVAVQQSGNSSDEEESDSEGETDNEELETELITDSGFILDAENTIINTHIITVPHYH